MKLYEHNGKIYEIKIVEGVEIIESEGKPGPGWIQVDVDNLMILKHFQKKSQRRVEILTEFLKDIELPSDFKDSASENIRDN
jgi:hypothetical protein